MSLKNKVFLFLSVVLFVIGWPGFSFANSAKCQKIFTLTKEEVAGRVLKDREAFIRDYKGREGYLRFVEELEKKAEMGYVFQIVSSILSGREKKSLDWQTYSGSVADFRADRSRMLDEEGRVGDEYKGMDGYALFADRHYEGDMFKTYRNLSAVLEKRQMRSLGWQAYKGSVRNFQKDRSGILDGEGKIKAEYKGMDGYALFAKRRYKGDMLKAYHNLSAVLEKRQMRSLGWRTYQGSVKNFQKDRSKALIKIKLEYKGMEGYARFADRYYEGDMFKAYKNLSAVLETIKIKVLGWRQYTGSVKQFREELEKILDKSGDARDEYKGMEGYALFADRHYEGDMFKAYINLSAVLEKRQMRSLGWRQYTGSVENFRADRSRMLDEEGKIKDEYRGMEGYALFAERHYEGEMLKAYTNLSAVLEKTKMRALGWQAYRGSVENFRADRSRILDGEGKIKAEYKGMEAYARFADRYYEGDMFKAYLNLSAVLEKTKMRALGWQAYRGSVESFREDRSRILDGGEKIKAEYKGMEGYARFADRYYEGDMVKAYMNISSVLEKTKMKALDWRAYHGSVENFRRDRSRLLDRGGKIKDEYKKMEGYALFAEKHYEGDMLKAYRNLSIALGRGWVWSLGWRQYGGSVKNFREDYSRILDKEGKIRDEYKGMDGYALFADRHYEGDMLKAYLNLSAVLGGFRQIRDLDLGWRRFQGSTSQYHALKRLFEAYGLEGLRGAEGHKKVAEIFRGDKHSAYRNVSVLRKELLESHSAFNNLNWTEGS